MPTLEGTAKQLVGNYKYRKEQTRKCYEAANERGWSLFTVSGDGECSSGPDAIYIYPANGFVSGPKGSSTVVRVYVIPGKPFLTYLVSNITVQ